MNLFSDWLENMAIQFLAKRNVVYLIPSEQRKYFEAGIDIINNTDQDYFVMLLEIKND